MTRKQQGFTLIELVAVIVILGALAVVALPRFINLQDEAETAALDGVKGAASSAHAVNLAGALASDQNFIRSVTGCGDTPSIMQSESELDDYSFANATGGSTGSDTGDPMDCVVTQDTTGNSAAFTGYHVDE